MVLDIIKNLWNSDVNLKNVHSVLNTEGLSCPTYNLSCEVVVMCMLCTVLINFYSVSVL